MNRFHRCLKFFLLVIVGVGAVGWLIMSLWNWLLPTLFDGIHAISYLQALGLFLLCRLLFGGFRGHGHCGWKREPGQWEQRWERWQQMSTEERSKFRDALRSTRGGWGRRSQNEVRQQNPDEPA
jgi:hypothetical protein